MADEQGSGSGIGSKTSERNAPAAGPPSPVETSGNEGPGSETPPKVERKAKRAGEPAPIKPRR